MSLLSRPMRSEDTVFLLFQDEEIDQQLEEEQEGTLNHTVKQLSLEDAVAFKLRRGQAQIKVRELRSKGLSFQIWPAAHTLCWYLEDMFAHTGMFKPHSSHFSTSGNSAGKRNLRVLELGAGTGMVGMVCAVLGGQCTTTDLPHVISNLEYNAALNQEAIQRSGLGGSVIVKSLRWGERADVEAIRDSFDLIVASDVVYYNHLFEPLLSTLKWLLNSLPSHMAASSEDGFVPATAATGTTATSTTGTTMKTGILNSSYVMLEEGASTCSPTLEPIDVALRITEDLSLALPNIGENSTILGEALLQVSDAQAAPPRSISSFATRSIPLIGEETTPVLLLSHLRRWKKDSHFFRKASKLFHVTVVHKDPHDTNSRTGVTIYSFSAKKK